MSPFIILTDTAGTIKRRICFSLPDGYPMIFVHDSYYASPPQIDGKEVIAKARFAGRITDLTQ